MNTAVYIDPKKSNKPEWNMNLKPHTATVERTPPRIVGLEIRPDKGWSIDHLHLTTHVERTLMRHPQFNRLSVVPLHCLFLRQEVTHSIRGRH